jgi:hypothetical protein
LVVAPVPARSRRGEWCSKTAGSDVTSATAGLMIVGLFQQSDERTATMAERPG